MVVGSDASNQRAKLGIMLGVKKIDFCADAVNGMLLPIYLLKCKNLRLLDSGSADDELIEEEERGTYKDIIAHWRAIG
jgi:hypothetical protein